MTQLSPVLAVTASDPRIRIERTRPQSSLSSETPSFEDALGAAAPAVVGRAAAALNPSAAGVVAAVAQQAAGLWTSWDGGLATGDAATYLRMQQQIQSENRRFTALSNVLKARHETAQNAINNIR